VGGDQAPTPLSARAAEVTASSNIRNRPRSERFSGDLAAIRYGWKCNARATTPMVSGRNGNGIESPATLVSLASAYWPYAEPSISRKAIKEVLRRRGQVHISGT